MAHPRRAGPKPALDKEVIRQIWRITGSVENKLAVYYDPQRPSDLKYHAMPLDAEPPEFHRFGPQHRFAGYANPDTGELIDHIDGTRTATPNPDDYTWSEIIIMLCKALLKIGLVVLTVIFVVIALILSVLGWGAPRRTYNNWSGISK